MTRLEVNAVFDTVSFTLALRAFGLVSTMFLLTQIQIAPQLTIKEVTEALTEQLIVQVKGGAVN